MPDATTAERRAAAAAEFGRHTGRQDGAAVVAQLLLGWNQVRDLLFERIHRDVRQNVGQDSLLLSGVGPLAVARTRLEIEIFQAAESAAVAREQNLWPEGDSWAEAWLAQLRLSEAASLDSTRKRLESYRGQPANGRRRIFSVVLEHAWPEARKAPLLIYRLFPLAVQAVFGLAIGQHDLAQAARQQQRGFLPAIGECSYCWGRLLDLGEACKLCGNPFWKYEWLND